MVVYFFTDSLNPIISSFCDTLLFISLFTHQVKKIYGTIDVTKPMDNSKSKKEGVSRTYKGFDGYAPMMAYIGTEGYAINFELREGKQHCQKGTVEFLQETINLCHKLTDKPLLIRLDSGNDSIDNVAVLMDAGCFFIIKRNFRRESTDDWFEMAKQCCQHVTSPRD